MQPNQTKSQRNSKFRNAFNVLVSIVGFLATPLVGHAANGTWINLVGGDASGSWTNTSNWSGGAIADGSGFTADFSTLEITTNSTVPLDGGRTIGNITFGDTTPGSSWTLTPGLPATSLLTLAVGAGSPTLTANAGTSNTITASILTSAGLTKAGVGTLRLNAASTLLSNIVVVSSGILQVGNNNALGTNGNHTYNERVVSTNGGTLEILNTIQPNNKHLTILGAGVGGTRGALFAAITNNGTSTRWGLSSLNASGVSGNSSAAFPAITMVGDATIRIDGVPHFNAPIGANDPTFAIGHISSTNGPGAAIAPAFTLTKLGLGRLSLDRGISGVTNVIVQEGGWSPNTAAGMGAIQYYTVKANGAILNFQNNCFGNSASIVMETGSFFDINWRGNGGPANDNTTYTQNIGYLNGTGILTTGSRGATNAQTLVIQGPDGSSNSVFNGLITVSNAITKFNITKNGTNVLSFGGNNNYSGISTVNSGTWLVNGSHTGGGDYTVNAGALLGGTGTIRPTINLNSGWLVAGNNGGTLTVSNVNGFGDIYVTKAGLTVLGQVGFGGAINTLYLTNSTTTAKLQQNGIDASIYVTTLNVDGVNNVLSYTTDNPSIGQFPFIKYGSSIGGLNGFAGLLLVSPVGITATLSNNVANQSIDIVITAIPALVWRGTPTGDWSIGGSANWLNGVTPSAYAETAGIGPFVIFNDTAAGTATVNLTTTVTPKGITVNSTSKNYTFTGSGLVNSNGAWIKDGTSTLTLANSGSNTIAGTITVNAGAVSVGNGGTSGNLGGANVNLASSGSSLIFNRSDNVTLGNSISGSGTLVKNAANTTTLTGVGNIGGNITVNAGKLALGPTGTITVSGDVTGPGAFGVNGPGTVIVSSPTVSYTGGTVITNGTLQLDAAFPPSGAIANYGTLAVGASGTLANNISGTGNVKLINNSFVTLSGANTYSGSTVVLGGSVDATASTYSPNSALQLGSQTADPEIGTANFSAGNPVLAGLRVGGSNSIFQSTLNLAGVGQTLTVNGNVAIGNTPISAVVQFLVTGTGASLVVNTNGGTFQLGLGATSTGFNPDYVVADFSQLDNFVVNLGATGVMNLGTVDGNPGPPTGATVLNQLRGAALSNNITAGSLNIGAGGRQVIPELRLGGGTNVLNVTTLGVGVGGRDGGYLLFDGGTGGLRVRGNDGVSPATMRVGYNPASATGASITNTVDLAGHPVDLSLDTLTIGQINNVGVYQHTFTFDTGVLAANATALSVTRNTANGDNTAASFSTLNINGGVASLGAVNLTASAAQGNLNVANASLAVSNITSPGAGLATFDLNNSTLNLNLGAAGGLVTPAVNVDVFNANGAIPVNLSGVGFTVGQHALIKYTGSIGGAGYSALFLGTLPSGVTATLSNNIANASVDLVVTTAPALVNTTPGTLGSSVTGNTLNLSWSPDRLGWNVQSNSVSVASSSDWHTITGSSLVTNLSLTINPSKTNVFYRMIYP